MKKIVLTSLLIFSFFVAPDFANAQACASKIDGEACPGGTCRVDPEGTFYCAPTGTPGLTSPGAGGGETSVTGLKPKPAPSSGTINASYLEYYRKLIEWAVNFVILPVVIAIAFLVFIWGVYKYFILGAANEDQRKEGRQFVLWGVIGFVIIFSVWGLVNIVSATLGLRSGGSSPPTPTINMGGSSSGGNSVPRAGSGSTPTFGGVGTVKGGSGGESTGSNSSGSGTAAPSHTTWNTGTQECSEDAAGNVTCTPETTSSVEGGGTGAPTDEDPLPTETSLYDPVEDPEATPI